MIKSLPAGSFKEFQIDGSTFKTAKKVTIMMEYFVAERMLDHRRIFDVW